VEVGTTFTVQKDDVTISTRVVTEIDPGGLEVEAKTAKQDAKDAVKIKVSGSLRDIMKTRKISHAQIQVTEVLDNPFFDDKSAVISTPVVNLQIKDGTYGGDRLPISLDGVDKPIEIIMPLKSLAKLMLEGSKATRTVVLKPLNLISDDDIDPFHLILPYNARVEVTIADHPMDAEFSVGSHCRTLEVR
jgi:hypothetical protein